MGKVATYIVVMSGLMLLFYFSGLLGGTPNSDLLDILLGAENLSSSSLFSKIVIALEGIALVGIIVAGAFMRSPELILLGTFSVYLINLFMDFIKVYAVVFASNPVIATLLFAPLLALWGIAVVDWWRGRD
jgi:hypothetical protein|tara:strand:+ start:1432 stop:1824 length:393 start_codon:yes stop_codon:yes gene_type:complete